MPVVDKVNGDEMSSAMGTERVRSGTAVTAYRRPGQAQRDPVRFARRRRRMDAVLQVGTPIALLIAWQLFSNAEVINPRWFPPPTQVARAMRTMIENGLLWDALVVSARRIALGYLLGSAVGVIVGLILGRIRSLRVAFEPVISALYTVPKLALLPLMLLVFGLGDLPKVLLIALSVFFIVVIATLSAVVDVPGAYLEPARSFDATELQTMRHVVLPSIIPPCLCRPEDCCRDRCTRVDRCRVRPRWKGARMDDLELVAAIHDGPHVRRHRHDIVAGGGLPEPRQAHRSMDCSVEHRRCSRQSRRVIGRTTRGS